MKHGDIYTNNAGDVLMYIDNSIPCNNVINEGVYVEVRNVQRAGVSLMIRKPKRKQSSIIKLNHKPEYIKKELGINIIDILKEAGL